MVVIRSTDKALQMVSDYLCKRFPKRIFRCELRNGIFMILADVTSIEKRVCQLIGKAYLDGIRSVVNKHSNETMIMR